MKVDRRVFSDWVNVVMACITEKITVLRKKYINIHKEQVLENPLYTCILHCPLKNNVSILFKEAYATRGAQY